VTANPPNENSKHGNTSLFKNRIVVKDRRPKSFCPHCLNPGTSTCTTQLMQYRCLRGHEWTATRTQGERLADFLTRIHQADVRQGH
jgi:hypothetical protein